MRRTKIVSTLGPASNQLEVLRKMVAAGVDIVRLNFSHGTAEEKRSLVSLVRTAAQAENRIVGILADLQGPKIRISKFKEGSIKLQAGAKFVLDADLPKEAGDLTTVGIDYKELPKDLKTGDVLLLDDGRLVLTVDRVEGNRIICTVKVGGILSNNKGINKQFGGLSAGALTDKDRADLKTAVSLDVDYIAISFVRSKQDVEESKALIAQEQGRAKVIAKIERIEAIVPETLNEIIAATDGIMVARGDLGVEIGEVEVPAAQKFMIECAHRLNKPVITATQMLETMIHNVVPTRAEVSDVANAVLDGTDAVMLSAETATGDHPALVIQTMSNICAAAERQPHYLSSTCCAQGKNYPQVGVAIAAAAGHLAKHLEVSAVLTFTTSGLSALWSSKYRLNNLPIYAFSQDPIILGQMALYSGVYPIAGDLPTQDAAKLQAAMLLKAKELGLVKSGELVIVLGTTSQQEEMDTLTVVRVH